MITWLLIGLCLTLNIAGPVIIIIASLRTTITNKWPIEKYDPVIHF